MKYRFGLQPEKWVDVMDDFVLLGPLSKKVVVADRLSVREEMSPVRSQGQEGSCGGQAMGAGVDEYLQKKDYKEFIPLSTRWIYNLARDRGGFQEGCTLSDLCYVAQKQGICEERFWPYVAGDQSDEPLFPVLNKETVVKNALKYRIKSYARVPDLDRLLVAMNDPLVQCVLIGINVYKGMVEKPCTETGIVPDPSCFQRPLGGHALATSAYDLKSQFYKKPGHVEVKNSWGKSYGDAGFNKLSLAYIKNNMTSAYACIDIPKEELEKKTITVADISMFDVKKDRLWIPRA